MIEQICRIPLSNQRFEGRCHRNNQKVLKWPYVGHAKTLAGTSFWAFFFLSPPFSFRLLLFSLVSPAYLSSPPPPPVTVAVCFTLCPLLRRPRPHLAFTQGRNKKVQRQLQANNLQVLSLFNLQCSHPS